MQSYLLQEKRLYKSKEDPTYYSLPIIDLYKVSFTLIISSFFDSLHSAIIGIPIGLDSSMPIFFQNLLDILGLSYVYPIFDLSNLQSNKEFNLSKY